MYSKKSGLIIGFHGCDETVRDAVIKGEELRPSVNSYDWLGNGVYFWESDPLRAYEWAEMLSKNPSSSVKTPAVLGAVIDLGHCLDLTNRGSVQFLQMGYQVLKKQFDIMKKTMPQNKNISGNNDLLLRYLDCSVIQTLQTTLKNSAELGMPFDSVRGLFIEGKPAYEGAGFSEKTHTQICIVNPNCIKGYFLPREKDLSFPNP